jgi:P-type Ca2+ transporter type 2C
METWHNLNTDEVLNKLQSDSLKGLTSGEAAERLSRYGPNVLVEKEQKSPWLILWEQLTAVMVLILLIAAIITIFLREYTDAVVIIVIVIINTILGFSQEYRAEKAMAALKKLAVPFIRVRRDGHVREILAHDLVPGDIVVFEAGNIVPADCRILEGFNLRIQEAALTGESEPVEKDPDAVVSSEAPLGDRYTMAYMGTIITYGRGLAAVTGTGMNTELGAIAAMIQKVEREPTPLQKRLDQLGKKLAVIALLLIGVLVIIGLVRGNSLGVIFLTAISMAVAAVPEGLPAVVTIALALGAQRMLKKRALIRKLPAVETLGSVTVICSDKTGTLTENNMTAVILETADQRVDLTGFPLLIPESDRGKMLSRENSALTILLTGSMLCNDAVLKETKDEQPVFRTVGDPTEGALVTAAARFGIEKPFQSQVFPRVSEVPFDSDRKRMTTIHKFPDALSRISDTPETLWLPDLTEMGTPYVAFTKGAVDSLLDISSQVWSGSHAEPMDAVWRSRITEANESMTSNGMRVLGLAFRTLKKSETEGVGESIEHNLIFVGMVGMIDPARPEAREAVATCKTAGIRPIMITGDHPLTARYIAGELGIYEDGPILTGQDMSKMSVEELEQVVNDVSVYARVSPEHKLKIIDALQAKGHIAAMTGDGVNDAPALKKSDIGVAMGITGTDVAKEAADMVLLDDNFATIVAAVKEGRVIYDNIRKFFKYLMTSNSAELAVMIFAPFLGMPLPLLPLQILWINLLTDGLPAVALAVEPAEGNTMSRPPYRPRESIFSRGMGTHIVWVGILMASISLFMGFWYWYTQRSDWQTMVFTTLTFSQMAHVMAIRSGRDSLFTSGLFSNTPLFISVLITFVLQIAVVYVPFLQKAFKTESLPVNDFIVSIALSSIIFIAVEIEKLVIRRKNL